MFKAMMKVSKEFFMYESGVYKCSNVTEGSKTGYHSVRIVGWGEEQQDGKNVKYWVGIHFTVYYIIIYDILTHNEFQMNTIRQSNMYKII